MRGEKNATLPPPRGHGCERHHDDGIDLNLNENDDGDGDGESLLFLCGRRRR